MKTKAGRNSGKGFAMVMGMLVVVLLTYFVSLAEARTSDGYIHNNHWYAVSYDGEGDAIVRAKISLENTLREDLDYLVFEVPGHITVYRIVEEKGFCGPQPLYQDYRVIEEPAYYEPSYYGGCVNGNTSLDYNKDYSSSSTFLRFRLANPLKEGERTSITLLYKIPGSAEKGLGKYDFDFKTIIDSKAILVEKVRVAVSVAPGYYLNEGGGEVDYRKDFFSAGMAQEAASKSIAAPEYMDYSRNIEYAQGYVEQASNLDAWESFHVKGSYSGSWVYMNLLKLLVGAIALAGLAFVSRTALRKALSLSSSRNKRSVASALSGNAAGRIIATGFLCAIGLVLLYFIALGGAHLLYGLPWYYRELTSLIGALIMVVLSLGVVIVPAVIQGRKHGIAEGFLVVGSTLLWALVLAFILAIVMALVFSPYKVVYETALAG